MGQDAFGNYRVNLPIISPSPLVPGGGTLTGSGAPSDSDGENGNVYVDIDTGDLYVKTGDTWVLKATGVQVLEYTGSDPTSDGLTPDSINSPAIAYKRDGSTSTYVWNTDLHIWN